MSAPKGNQFWKERSSHGPNPKFEIPDDLLNACVEYMEWSESNPLYEAKAFHSGGEIITANLPKMRAMTIGALCTFLDITEVTWREWRKERKDLSTVIARVEQIIRSQKFEGASADLLNAKIIARDLGLSNKTETKVELTHDFVAAAEAFANVLTTRASRK